MTDLNVLVVDDEPLVAAGHAEYVGRVAGFRVVGVAHGVRETLALLAAQPVDLILLDLNLPDGHGLDAVRALRASGRSVDVLAITAAREVELVRTAVSLGVIGYLLKPFTFPDLRERLEGYRRYREGLTGSSSASQAHVDAAFQALRQPVTAGAHTPKGLAPEVLDRVIDHLRTAGAERSASDVAAALGTSRVTARRYLQYLVDSGRVERGQRLVGSGRPEVTFTWRR